MLLVIPSCEDVVRAKERPDQRALHQVSQQTFDLADMFYQKLFFEGVLRLGVGEENFFHIVVTVSDPVNR